MIDHALLAEIRALHEGPERGYHGWSHIEALLALLTEVQDRLSDPVAVRAAILMHDAVYDPARPDNEHASAELAARMLRGVVPEPSLQRALRLIEATARHAIPDGLPPDETGDMAIFLDMDLSILGAAPEAFAAYEAGVRHEYRAVPETLFRAGRARILEQFRARPSLYLSDWGRTRFEAAARKNLAASVARLNSGSSA